MAAVTPKTASLASSSNAPKQADADEHSSLRPKKRRAGNPEEALQQSKRARGFASVQLQTPKRSQRGTRTRTRGHTNQQTQSVEPEIHVHPLGAEVEAFIADGDYADSQMAAAPEDTFSPEKHVDNMVSTGLRVSFAPKVDYASPRTEADTSVGETSVAKSPLRDISQSQAATPSATSSQDVYDVPDDAENPPISASDEENIRSIVDDSGKGSVDKERAPPPLASGALQVDDEEKMRSIVGDSDSDKVDNERASRPLASGAFPAPEVVDDVSDSDGLEMVMEVKPEKLSIMLRAMRETAWTGEGDGWMSNLISRGKPQKEVKRWMNNHVAGLEAPAAKLFRYCHVLWCLFDRAPYLAVSEPAAQIAFFQDPATKRKLKGSVQEIENLVDYFCRQTSSTNVARVKGLAEKVIPLLTLTLQAAFAMGDPEKRKRTKADPAPVPTETNLTPNTLRVLIKITGWMESLHGAIMKAFEGTEDRRVLRRSHLKRHIHHLHQYLHDTLVFEPEEPESVRRERLVEKDQQARLVAQEKARKQQEAQDHQMALFLASTQGMGRRSAILSSTRETPKVDPKEKYREENYGWSWEEDDRLLTLIRRTQNINVQNTVESFPGHDVADIRKRIRELRDKARRFYEARNMVPPWWCS